MSTGKGAILVDDYNYENNSALIQSALSYIEFVSCNVEHRADLGVYVLDGEIPDLPPPVCGGVYPHYELSISIDEEGVLVGAAITEFPLSSMMINAL